jgi:hypothetical protein
VYSALRPYITTGVAIVGASVIAVTPIQPIPANTPTNAPVQLSSPVRLAANEIENLVNGLTFVGAEILVTLAKLPAPIVAAVAGTTPGVADLLLSIGALVAAGPLIGATGGTGVALQDIADAVGTGNIAGVLGGLLSAPTKVFGGLVNGEVGPNLGPLIPIIPSFLAVLTGGLLNSGGLNLSKGLILPGLIPALGLAISLISGQFGAADMVNATLADESARAFTELETKNTETGATGLELASGTGGIGAFALSGGSEGGQGDANDGNTGGGVVTGTGGDGSVSGDLDGHDGGDTGGVTGGKDAGGDIDEGANAGDDIGQDGNAGDDIDHDANAGDDGNSTDGTIGGDNADDQNTDGATDAGHGDGGNTDGGAAGDS